MADLPCPGCKRPVDFQRAKIEPAEDLQEIVTCPEGGRIEAPAVPLVRGGR